MYDVAASLQFPRVVLGSNAGLHVFLLGVDDAEFAAKLTVKQVLDGGKSEVPVTGDLAADEELTIE